MASSGNGQSILTFSASEDLGDGMKAFANIRLNPSIYTGTLTQDVSEVGISGAFGTVQLAKDFGIDFAVHAAADASGWTGAGSTGGVVHNTAAKSGNAVIYVLPTMVSGLGIVVANGLAGAAGGAGDGTAYRITYNIGSLSLQYAGASTKNSATSEWTTGSFIGGATATTDTLTAGTKSGLTALAVTYDLGMAKLHFGSFTGKGGSDGDQKSSSSMYGVSVPFGATTVGLTSSSAQRTSAAAATVKETGMRIKVAYALSKRTTAYLANGTAKLSGTRASNQQTAIGLTHAF